MRRPDGLTVAELATFEATLLGSHVTRTRVIALDRDELPVRRFTPRVLSGSVDVDTSRIPTRSASLDLVDTDRSLEFAPGSAAEAAAFADSFIQITRDIYVPALGRWVEVPVITGPITSLSRRGALVSIEITGKEALALAPAVLWTDENAKLLPRGLSKITAIRRLLAAQGERKFALPETPASTLKEPIHLDRLAEPWIVAGKIAASMNMQLYYDGAGYLRLRGRPADRVFAFRTTELEGAPPNVLERPELAFDLSAVRNIYEVLGPEPDGKGKDRLRYAAKATGALSPTALARNGEPRWLVESEEIDHAKRLADVRAVAERGLERTSKIAVTIGFSGLPAPHLEELDPVALYDEGVWTAFDLVSFTIPLVAGEAMSYNSLRRISAAKRRAS